MDEMDLDEDFVFEPTGWDMATEMRIGVDPESDSEALDELADAMLLWLEGPKLERLVDEAVERIWSNELEQLIRQGLAELREWDGWQRGVDQAVAELDRDPRAAEVSREVACHLAMQLAQEHIPVFFCFDCLDTEVSSAPRRERRRRSLQAVVVAARGIDLTDSSLSARRQLRARLGRLAELGVDQVPALAAELRTIAGTPAPPLAEDDEVWRALKDSARREVAHLN